MKIKRNTLFFIMRMTVLFVAGLIVAFVVALSQVNLESLRGTIVAMLRDASGLPVEIRGDLSWKFSLRPQIHVTDVRIPNAAWAKNEYAFIAKHIDITVDLISLFHNRPTIQNVKIYDADINLEQNESGQYSVEPFAGDANKNDVKIDAEPAQYPFIDPGLGGIEVKNLSAYIIDDTYFVPGFQVRYLPSNNRREYSGWIKTQTDVYPFVVAFLQYNAERKIYPVNFALSTGGDALIANIALEGTSKMPIDFVIKGEIPNLSDVVTIFNIKLDDVVPPLKISLSGGMDHNKVNIYKSSIIAKDAEFNISGSVDWAKNKPMIVADVHVDSLNWLKMFPQIYSGNWVHPDRELNAFQDVSLYGSEFLRANMNLHIDIESMVVYRNLDLRDIDIKLKVTDGVGRLNARVGIGGGVITAASDIDIDETGRLDVKFGGMGRDIYVGEILHQIRINDFISELPVNFDAYAIGNGATLSELMQTVTGPVVAYSTAPGYAHSQIVENIYGTDFLTTLRHNIQDLFRSEKQHDQIKISCAVANLKLRSGRAETQNGVAVQTKAINLRLAGDLDLGKETMNLSLITVPVRGLKLSLTGNVVNAIEITGNLSEPDVRISASAVVGKVASATGLGLLLAPFTGGLSLVAGAGVGLLAGDLLENWLADDSPCQTAMERGAPAKRDDPKLMDIPVGELVQEIMNK